MSAELEFIHILEVMLVIQVLLSALAVSICGSFRTDLKPRALGSAKTRAQDNPSIRGSQNDESSFG